MATVDEWLQQQEEEERLANAARERKEAFAELPVAPRDTPFLAGPDSTVIQPYTDETLGRVASGELQLHPQAIYPLVHPESGRTMSATGADVERLSRFGWSLANDYSARLREYKEGMEEAYGGAAGQAQSGLAGAADALTLGLYSGVAGLTGHGKTVERSIEYNPGTNTVGLIAGSLLSLTPVGAGTAAGRLARGAMGMGERFAAQAGGGLAARAAGTALGAAVEGGVAASTITAGAGLRRGEEASTIAHNALKEGLLGSAMGGALGLGGQLLIAEPAGAVYRKLRASKFDNDTVAALSDAVTTMDPLIRAEGKLALADATIAKKISASEEKLASLRAAQGTPEDIAAAAEDLKTWKALEADMARAVTTADAAPTLRRLRDEAAAEVEAKVAAKASPEDIATAEAAVTELNDQLKAALRTETIQGQLAEIDSLIAGKQALDPDQAKALRADRDALNKELKAAEKARKAEAEAAKKYEADMKEALASESLVVRDDAVDHVLGIRREGDRVWSLARYLRRRARDLDDLATPPTAEYRQAVEGYFDDAAEDAYLRMINAADAFDDHMSVPTKTGRTAKTASLSTVQRRDRLVNEGFQTADAQNRVNKRAKAGMVAEFDESGRLLEALDLDKNPAIAKAIRDKMAKDPDGTRRVIAEYKAAVADAAEHMKRVSSQLLDDGVYDMAPVLAHPVEEPGKRLFFDPMATGSLRDAAVRGVDDLRGLSPLVSSGGAERARQLGVKAAAAMDNASAWEANIAKIADMFDEIRLRESQGAEVLKLTGRAMKWGKKLESIPQPGMSRAKLLEERNAWRDEVKSLRAKKGPTAAELDRLAKLESQLSAAEAVPATARADLEAARANRLAVKAKIDGYEMGRRELLKTEQQLAKRQASRQKLAEQRAAAKEAMRYKEQLEVLMPQLESKFGVIPQEAIVAEAVMMGFDEAIPDEVEFLIRARLYRRAIGAVGMKVSKGAGLVGRLSEAMMGGAGREIARQGLFSSFPGLRGGLAGRGVLGALTTGAAHLSRAGAKKAFRGGMAGAKQAAASTGKSLMELEKAYVASLDNASRALRRGVRGGARIGSWLNAAHTAMARAEFADIEHEAYSGLDPITRNFEKRAAELDAVASDPQKAYQYALSRVAEPIAPDDPELAHAIAARVADNLVYLHSKLPPPRPRYPGDMRRNASKAEMSRFATLIATERHPAQVLERMAVGTATPAEVEAAHQFHPILAGDLLRQANEMLMDGSMGNLQRVKLSVSLSIPGPGNPDAALRGRDASVRYMEKGQVGAMQQQPQARPYVKQDIAPPPTRAQRLGE